VPVPAPVTISKLNPLRRAAATMPATVSRRPRPPRCVVARHDVLQVAGIGLQAAQPQARLGGNGAASASTCASLAAPVRL
jgi:hypothetical protein